MNSRQDYDQVGATQIYAPVERGFCPADTTSIPTTSRLLIYRASAW